MHDAEFYDTDEDYARAGDVLGRGLFRCTACGHAHEALDASQPLPACGHCGGAEWEILALFG